MTKEGQLQLEAKLKDLKEEKLPRIQKAIGLALEHGASATASRTGSSPWFSTKPPSIA